MQIDFSLPVILNGAIVVLGLFVAFALWWKKENRLANRLMSLFLASISLWLIDSFLRVSGVYSQNANLYFLPIYYSFAFGPLLYFYVKSITNSEFSFAKQHLLHFIPVFLQAGLYLFLSFQDYGFKHWYWEEVHFPITYRIEFDGSFISMAIYLFLSLLLLLKYQEWLKENYSETSKNTLSWLFLIFSIMLGLTLLWFAEAILRDFYSSYNSLNATVFVLALLTLILAFRAFYQADQKDINYKSGMTAENKSKALSFDNSVLLQITNRMELKQDYLDPTLSLKTFAANCKLPQKLVSQYLNQKLNKTFHDFVNEYRVEEFKILIAENRDQNFTLEGLAYESGFNSKATFNRTFKKFTGTTPSQFVSK